MGIPLTYNLRNLSVRRTTTALTALGIGLTVAVLLAALALISGLRAAFASTGSPRNLLVLRKGSTSELSSTLTEETYRQVLYAPGIAAAGDGRPLVSLEIVTVITLPKPGSMSGQPITLRGLLPAGIEMRNLGLEEGRWFQAGRRELVVGASVARRCPAARIGSQLRIGNSDWDVVGVMDAGASAVNSEVFADLNQVAGNFNRREQFNSILLRSDSETAVPGLVESLANDPRLNVTAQPERAYYARQTASGAPLQNLGIMVALIMSVGSSFAAMNTMYATVSRRSSEIGTLRVLGFTRSSILFSFLIESVILAGLGGLVGCLLVLPLNRVTTAVGNFTSMSETAFRFHVGPEIMLAGVVFAVVIGAAGGFLPARMAAGKEILTALRET